jgi:hypothetical protein
VIPAALASNLTKYSSGREASAVNNALASFWKCYDRQSSARAARTLGVTLRGRDHAIRDIRNITTTITRAGVSVSMRRTSDAGMPGRSEIAQPNAASALLHLGKPAAHGIQRDHDEQPHGVNSGEADPVVRWIRTRRNC